MLTSESIIQPWFCVSQAPRERGGRMVALLGYSPEDNDPCLAWAKWDEDNQRWVGWGYLFPPQYYMPLPDLPNSH